MQNNLKFTSDYEIEDLGVVEDYVYDIEVDGNHNFFGNDILVHNSVYLNFSPLIEKVFGTADITNEQGEKFLDDICKLKFEDVIKNGYEKLAMDLGAFKNAMTMKREKINAKAVFVAKKKYLLYTLNSEGVHYEEPKISVTGLEMVRSSTPEVCRKKMKEGFKVLLGEDEKAMQKFIADFEEEFRTLDPNEISKISGTDDIEKWMDSVTGWKKGVPYHVRGAITYNNFLKEKKLTKKYEKIVSGDKINILYLKLPNPVRQNLISFNRFLPEEFGLKEYVDYDKQFDVVFLKPMKLVLDAVGWNPRHVSTLEAFFG